MTDSRHIEGQAPTTEKEQVKTLYVGQEFTFFNRSTSPNKSELVETADIKNATSDSPIGALIGRARTLDGKPITSANQLRVAFEIQSKPETAKNPTSANITGEDHFDTEGSPFHNPVMIMVTPQGVFCSIGQPQVQGDNRTIKFDNWVKIPRSQGVTKAGIEQLTRKHAAQPRSLKLGELRTSKFKII